MKNAAKRAPSRGTRSILQAAEFKAEALAVMRRVQQTGRPVTITSRGKDSVRIEPIRAQRQRKAYGSMRGTVELTFSEQELVSTSPGEDWGTLAEWGEATKS